jgi:hypothetical protein
MGRILNLVLVGAMIIAAAITYDLKYNAESAANRVARLQTDVAREKAKIQALKAEWSMLDQPARLQALVEAHADYFKLAPFSPNQMATVGDIPMRPVPPDPIGELVSGVATDQPIALR